MSGIETLAAQLAEAKAARDHCEPGNGDRTTDASGSPSSDSTSTWPASDHTPVDEAKVPGKKSQATLLVDLVLGAGVELWHSPTSDAHITIKVDDHREHHPLAGRACRDWLARLYHAKTDRTPGATAITDALSTLGGMARYDGAEHHVHVRVAGRQQAVYLDLGDPNWRVVEVTADGWRAVTETPVRFRRGRALLALPEPMTGGSVDALREVIHLESDDDWRLLGAQLVGALRPSGPYPPTALDGEQGSGKSTTARMLRRLIDPSGAVLRAEPREIRDLMIAASGGWVIALDNLSHLQPWLSDALCRISTGGALSTRQLYTDGDEHIVEAVRPIILTGIANVVTRGDLQDRTITITLPAIPEYRRRPEADLWAAYDRIHPQVLGALLDAVSLALRRESEVRLASLPRMADWARWVTAAEPALGFSEGAVLRAYDSRRQHVTEQTLDGDVLAVAIRAPVRPWEGTAAQLLTRITPSPRAPRGWPESPRGLSGALRRLAPQLRRIGIEVTTDLREPGTGRRLITIEDTGAQRSQPSPSLQSPDSLAHCRDGRDASQTRPSLEQAGHRDGRDSRDGRGGSTPTSQEEEATGGDVDYYGA